VSGCATPNLHLQSVSRLLLEVLVLVRRRNVVDVVAVEAVAVAVVAAVVAQALAVAVPVAIVARDVVLVEGPLGEFLLVLLLAEAVAATLGVPL
jgi:hypothetical protein